MWIFNPKQSNKLPILFIFTFQNFGMWQTTTLKRNLILEIWRNARKKIWVWKMSGWLPPLKEIFVGSLGFWIPTKISFELNHLFGYFWNPEWVYFTSSFDILLVGVFGSLPQIFKTWLVVILTGILRLAALAYFKGHNFSTILWFGLNVVSLVGMSL